MTVEDLKIYLDDFPDDAPVYAYCDDETIHTVADIVYLAEPVEWRKTPNGDWNEYIYPVNTPVKIIGDSGYRGWDIKFVETGVKMLECIGVKLSSIPLDNYERKTYTSY